MELAAFFDLFLKNEVNLNKSRLDKLNEKIEIINKFFKENDKFKTIYKGLLPQGSYAQQTIIKPPKDKDFDADILLSLKQVPGWEPKDYCDKVFNEFRNNDNYSD